MNLYQIDLSTLVVIIKMEIMQLAMELPALKVLVTKCIQESVMTKTYHEWFIINLWYITVKDINASAQYITLSELQFSKLYLLCFFFANITNENCTQRFSQHTHTLADVA